MNHQNLFLNIFWEHIKSFNPKKKFSPNFTCLKLLQNNFGIRGNCRTCIVCWKLLLSLFFGNHWNNFRYSQLMGNNLINGNCLYVLKKYTRRCFNVLKNFLTYTGLTSSMHKTRTTFIWKRALLGLQRGPRDINVELQRVLVRSLIKFPLMASKFSVTKLVGPLQFA